MADSEWAKTLMDNMGTIPGQFDKELAQNQKLSGLSGRKGVTANTKLTANAMLINWLEESGDVYLKEESGWGQAPHPLAISSETIDELTNESSGRGLLARRAVNEEDELLKIPLELCFTKQSSRKTFGPEIIHDGLNEYLAIALQLIHEKFVTADESFYQPYINILPETNEVNPTFTWTSDDLQSLNGSPVIAATLSMKTKLQTEYNELLANDTTGLSTRHPNLFPKEHFTFENFEWAFTMLFSRAIRLRSLKRGETLAMVPYADLINHSPYSSSYLDAREAGDWIMKYDDIEEVILYADRGYRRMEQIYISYGPKSNADLLLLYGFALERNPYNSVDVTVSIGPPKTWRRNKNASDNTTATDTTNDILDPLAEEKSAFLDGVGRKNTVDFPCYADRYPTEMLEYLRLMMMTPEDTRGRNLSDFDYTRTISAANEASVLASIVNAIKSQLQKYPQTEEEDAAIIKDRTMFQFLSYNQRMAVRHRRKEKRLLKRTIAALEKQMKSRGLDIDMDELKRAEGSTLGQVLPGEKIKYGTKQRTALEERLEKMGLPVDLR